MSKENKKTVQVYQETAHLYLENSATHDQLDPEKAKRKQVRLQNLIKESFSSLPSHSKIFEIGSGEGFNAKFMQDLGFDNKLAQENIAKIDELIYLKTEESYNLQGEISSQKFNNTIKENLTAYLNEYIQVINGKHKGEYHSINQSVLSKNKERKKMIKKTTTKTIYKIVILFLILISSIWLILTNQYEVFISTVVIGALVGLLRLLQLVICLKKRKKKIGKT